MTDSKKHTITGILSNVYRGANSEGAPGVIMHPGNNLYQDWVVRDYNALMATRNALQSDRSEALETVETPLKPGMLLTVFNTIARGDVYWKGTVDLEWDREKQKGTSGFEQQAIFGMWVHGLERSMSPKEWASMFFLDMPAILEKSDGTIIHGHLDPFFETGTEGVIWSLCEYGKDSYDALNSIEDGDKLTVYETVSDGTIDWQGTLDFNESSQPQPYLVHDGQMKMKTKNMPRHMDAEKWQKLCWQKRPVKIEMKP